MPIPEKAVAPVEPREPALVVLDLGRLELLVHPAVHAVLDEALPRLAERHEASTALAEARLKGAPEDSDAEIAGRVRVAVLQDSRVVVAVAFLEVAEDLEEVRQPVGAGQVADRARRGDGDRDRDGRRARRRGRIGGGLQVRSAIGGGIARDRRGCRGHRRALRGRSSPSPHPKTPASTAMKGCSRTTKRIVACGDAPEQIPRERGRHSATRPQLFCHSERCTTGS